MPPTMTDMPDTMGQGNSAPPMPPAAKPPMDTGEQCVPLKVLAQPDDQDQMQTPAVGDTGSATVDYTVTKIDGDNAYIKVSAINGQPLDGSDAETAPDDSVDESGDAQEGQALQQQAQSMST